MNELGKDNTPVLTGRAKPEVITIGKTEIIPGGRWNNEAMANYVLKNGVDDWVEVGKLAKVGCGGNTMPNKKRVRSRLSQLFQLFVEKYGFFLAIDYGGHHNSASRVKVADLTSKDDFDNVQARLNRMHNRRELTQERHARFIQLLQSKRDAANGRDQG